MLLSQSVHKSHKGAVVAAVRKAATYIHTCIIRNEFLSNLWHGQADDLQTVAGVSPWYLLPTGSNTRGYDDTCESKSEHAG